MKTLGQFEIGLDTGLIQEVKAAVKGVVPGAQVILYGSQARAEAGPESDYDLLILFPHSASSEVEEVLNSLFYDLELKWNIVLSTLIYDLEVWNQPLYRALPLHQEIDREGILL